MLLSKWQSKIFPTKFKSTLKNSNFIFRKKEKYFYYCKLSFILKIVETDFIDTHRPIFKLDIHLWMKLLYGARWYFYFLWKFKLFRRLIWRGWRYKTLLYSNTFLSHALFHLYWFNITKATRLNKFQLFYSFPLHSIIHILQCN